MSDIVTDNPIGAANDIVMAKAMAETLHAAYPGHFWAVCCDGKKGMADVRNMRFSGMWGFRLRLPAIYSASEFKREVLRAGGELLERYRMSRGKFNEDQYSDIPMDAAGRLKADHG